MKQKFSWTMIIVALFSLFLLACSNGSVDKEKIIDQLVKNSQEVKSFDAKAKMAIDVDLSQAMSSSQASSDKTSSSSDMKISMAADMDMSVIQNPLTMKMNMKVNVFGQDMTIESYVKDNILYIKDPTSTAWFKQDNSEMIAQLQEQGQAAYNKEYFKLLQDNIKDVTIEEKDGNYVIDIKDASAAFQKVIQDQLKNLDGANAVANAEIKNMHLTYVIDKKTNYPLSMILEADIASDNTPAHMKIEATYSNINQVKEIKIPDAALKTEKAA